MQASADEVREAMRWAQSAGREWGVPRATAAVERWHEVTGCQWSGPHGVIRAVLDGHTKWPGAKAPKPANLGLYHQLKQQDDFWVARSWILTPGAPSESSTVVGADVNAQYVAAASSVELGEGDPEHWVPGETLPDDVLKRPGWVRLGRAVKNAPHGLHLPQALWVPTPLAVYLTRDKGITLDVAEALVWPERRKALSALARMFRDWSVTLKGGHTEADADALAMAKTVYTKALGGYLASDKGLTSEEWQRPDWEWQLKAQAEANFLRALDKLPPGCTPRAKYADAAFIEVSEGASLDAWPNLDPVQPGRLQIMGEKVPGGWFADADTPEDWRKTYALGGE